MFIDRLMQIIKRLLLKWHPDKNLEDQEFATIVTQHLHNEVERLELGLPRTKSAADFRAQNAPDPRNPFSGSETFQQNFYSAYQFFFEQMNQRAREHRENRERYKENFSREYANNFTTGSYQGGGNTNDRSPGNKGASGASGTFRSSFSFEVPPTFASTNPQPAQARRFMRQAQEDLLAADNDCDLERRPAYEWVCFKAHQVCRFHSF